MFLTSFFSSEKNRRLMFVLLAFHLCWLISFHRWEDHHKTECYSEHVEILFSAIYTSVNQFGAKASILQDRDVTKHLVQIVSIQQAPSHL
jgi:hypothetical protein